MRSFGPLVLLLSLACSSESSSGTTTGGSTSGGSNSGYDAGGQCPGAQCTTNSDCVVGCGQQFDCNPFSNSCCGVNGYNCASDDDCCSGYCQGNINNSVQICANQPGTNTGGSATAATSSSSSITGGPSASTGSATGSIAGSLGTSSATGTSGGSSSGATSGGVGGPALAFAWTFGGGLSCEGAGVSWLALTVNGANPTIFPCRDPNGVEGATLPAAQYFGTSVTVDAIAIADNGPNSSQIGQYSGQVFAPSSGISAVPINIPITTSQASSLEIDWTFSGLTTSQAAVTTIDLQVTNPTPAQDVSEVLDGGINGAILTGYGPGIYPVSLTGNGPATYSATGAISANGLTSSLLLVDLPVTTSGSSGIAVINFGLSFAGQSCAASGYDTVSLQLAKADGTALAAPATLNCADAGSSYVFVQVPAPTTAFLWLEGLAGNSVEDLTTAQIVISPGATSTYSVTAQPAP